MPLSTLHARLGGLWKAILLLAAIFSAGLTAGAAAGGLTNLPARVASLEATADTLQDQISGMRHDVAALRESNRIQLCMQIAEKRHTDWRECLKD
jgi:outer membrane murein-binding lipoprotein Lpp